MQIYNCIFLLFTSLTDYFSIEIIIINKKVRPLLDGAGHRRRAARHGRRLGRTHRRHGAEARDRAARQSDGCRSMRRAARSHVRRDRAAALAAAVGAARAGLDGVHIRVAAPRSRRTLIA